MTLGVINRIPSAHLGDAPLLSPNEVNYFPTDQDISRIRGWLKFKIGKIMSDHHQAFAGCGKLIEHPSITYPAAKRAKSKVSVVSLSVEDPASNDGMTRISEKLIKYIPQLPTGSRQKTVVFGDQLYVERGHSASWGRCGEKNPVNKLEGLIFIPQEWHKKQEDLIIYNQRFNMSHQVDSPGTLQNIKCSFGHNKASKDVSNYYAARQRLQNCNFHIYLQILVALGKNNSYINIGAIFIITPSPPAQRLTGNSKLNFKF